MVGKQNESADARQPLKKNNDGSWTWTDHGLTVKTAFQPIFAVSTGKLRPIACEGLLRVFSGQTRIATGSFFKAVPPGRLQEIEQNARTLHLRNAKTLAPSMRRLFINFDPTALGSPSAFEQTVQQIGKELAEAQISPGDVVCEITEQSVADASALKDFVYALRARGYLVAVDDFGARSSNSKRVEQLAPDIVKLDGAMVQHMLESPARYSKLIRLISSFRDNGIRVVLEGIQHSWHIPLAVKTGADYMQGFALAVPRLAPANFDEWTISQHEPEQKLTGS